MTFSQAIGAEPSLIGDEIRKFYHELDVFHGTIFRKSRAEREKDMKFTQGDYRRFCAVFYILTRKII